MKRSVWLFLAALALLLAQPGSAVQALGGLAAPNMAAPYMASPNYRLDWFTSLDGGGGGPMSSPHYAVNLTVGQSAVGTAGSANYQVGLGFWAGTGERVARQPVIYLPVVVR